MPKKIAQDVVRQIKQIGEETLKETVKQPGEMAGRALEQLGAGAGQNQPNQQSSVAGSPKARLEQMKAQDEIKSSQMAAKLKKELEEEIKKARLKREEELRQRRAQPKPAESEEPKKPPLPEVSTKRKRGVLGGLQIKSAKQKAQPETVGRRIGG